MIESKDIYLNHAKHVQSYRSLDLTLMPNLLSRTGVGSSSIRSFFTFKMEATFTQLRPQAAQSCCGGPLAMSGHQTQTRDFCREEGVQDEDNGLRTRVEVQLLGERKRRHFIIETK